MTPEQIAAGLTKAQQVEILAATKLEGFEIWAVRSNLLMEGDIWPDGVTQHHNSLCAVLKPLGLAVRSVLQREANPDNGPEDKLP